MDTKQLITFVTLAEVNNYLKASERLNYAPSTLAKHIQTLEEELGVRLVEYRRKRICLTPDGERFYGYASKIIDTYWAVTEAFASPVSMRGNVRVAGGEPIVGFSMARLLLDFSNRYPETVLNVQMACCARIPNWVREQEVDLGFIHEMEQKENDAYVSVPLYNEPICLVTTGSNPLARREAVTWPDMAGQRFAFTYDDCCFTAAFRERMRKEKLQNASELFLGSVSAVIRSVLQDDRIALIPYTALPNLKTEKLVCLPWQDEPLRAWVQIIYARNRQLPPAEKELIRQARQYAERLMAEDEAGQLRA